MNERYTENWTRPRPFAISAIVGVLLFWVVTFTLGFTLPV